jgi:hypothetical protein
MISVGEPLKSWRHMNRGGDSRRLTILSFESNETSKINGIQIPVSNFGDCNCVHFASLCNLTIAQDINRQGHRTFISWEFHEVRRPKYLNLKQRGLDLTRVF